MRVWIPFFPAQHVNCGCLVTRTEHLSENTSSPRRRHRPPRHAARAHIVCTFFCIVALYLESSKFYHVDTPRRTCDMAERNFSNISGAGSIVSKNARRSVGGLANPTTRSQDADRTASPSRQRAPSAGTPGHHRIAWIYVLCRAALTPRRIGTENRPQDEDRPGR